MTHGSDQPVKWSHFLTGRDDATVWNVSFLSSPAEWHALAVGVLAVVAPDVFMSVAPAELQALVAGVQSVGLGAAYSAGRGLRKYADSLHFRDALREPAYTTLGVMLGFVVITAVQYVPI
jgi:hypothetical protein